MPRNKPFHFLRNESGSADRFKKTRYPGPEEPEDEFDKIPSQFHKGRIRILTRNLVSDQNTRQSKRNLKIPYNFDTVRIHFFKRFDHDLQRFFLTKYGLQILCFEDFNKTVLFGIGDVRLFQVFVQHLTAFSESERNESYEGKDWSRIALIQRFFLLDSQRRKVSFSDALCTLEVFPLDRKSRQIHEALENYLRQAQKQFRILPHSASLEVENLRAPELTEILDNFDVIKAVTSSKTGRVKPGVFGGTIRDAGFSITANPNNVLVGIIDSGVSFHTPLRSVNSGISLDITNSGAFFDNIGHGTTVAGLVALGQDFLQNSRAVYESVANIATFKVVNNRNDELSIRGIIDGIRYLNEQQGIRLFNMSLNDSFHKPYNSGFSEFAFQLDKLGYELDILIMISTGNQSDSSIEDIQQLPHSGHAYPAHFYNVGRARTFHHCESTNICTPAESLNHLTIGAIAENFRPGFATGITPAKELPAVYTRKFHYDYQQKVNGTAFTRNQRSKQLNKPDLVFAGGDYLDLEAGMEVLGSPLANPGQFFIKTAGTSLATPLVTSMAAEICRLYPSLNCQTIKAILINSAGSPCGESPQMFQPNNLKPTLRRLIGRGLPSRDKILYSDENEVVFIVEESIWLENVIATPITLPEFVSKSKNKIKIEATLCYKFEPLANEHLAYCPLQIVFGFFRNVSVDIIAGQNADNYKITNGPTWSDDFFGAENRVYSNTQKISFNLDAEKLLSTNNEVTVAIKCTGKKEIDAGHRERIKNESHSFSLVISISETPKSRLSGQLYSEIIAINTVEAIATVDLQASLDNE